MVCEQCGRGVEPGDRFCTGCGTALERPQPPAPPEADDAVPEGDPVGEEPTERSATTDATTTDDDERASERLAVTETAATADEHEPDPVDAAATQPIPTSELPETRPLESVAPPGDRTADDEWDADPVWAATVETSVTTGDLPSTEPITEVWMSSVDDVETVADGEIAAGRAAAATTTLTTAPGPTATAEMPAASRAPAAAPEPNFRFGAVTLIGVLAGAVTLVSLFTTVISITSDERIIPREDTPVGFRTGTWIADDLADNLAIAGLVAAVFMVVGGVAAGFRWRWGSGLAGGAGLGFAGIAAIAIGLAQVPIDAAHEMALIPNEQRFTLTITRDAGYWLFVTAGAIGVVLFFASINDALHDRRPGLNPWIAALGALAAVVAAAGPLLPENLAAFSDNWYISESPGEPPAMLLVGRLVQLGLFALTGVIGFLSVRRWGLGLAIGGALPAVWLAASTLFDLTDRPVGPGFRNPGADDMHLHGVTIIGMSALGAMAVLAVIAAYDQGVHERR